MADQIKGKGARGCYCPRNSRVIKTGHFDKDISDSGYCLRFRKGHRRFREGHISIREGHRSIMEGHISTREVQLMKLIELNKYR